MVHQHYSDRVAREARGFLQSGFDTLTNSGKLKIVEAVEDLPQNLRHALPSIAWHGSPYVFDRFDMSHIGNGEGFQGFGHGLYFSSRREVAQWYRDQTSDLRIGDLDPDEIAEAFFDALLKKSSHHDTVAIGPTRQRCTRDEFIELWLDEEIDPFTFPASVRDEVEKKYRGSVYQVNLSPQDEDYLLWDKPLRAHSKKVFTPLFHKSSNEIAGHGDEKVIDASEWYDSDGRTIYRDIARKLGSDKAASDYLQNLGIRGIKYLDGDSRYANMFHEHAPQHYNYVIFDDADVDIIALHSRQNKNTVGLYHQGTIYLVANQIAYGETPDILRHEAVHLLMREDPQFIKVKDDVLERFSSLEPTDAKVREAYKSVPESTPAFLRDEEGFAYYVQKNPRRGLVRRMTSAAKAWMYRHSLPTTKFKAEDFTALVEQSFHSFVKQQKKKHSMVSRILDTLSPAPAFSQKDIGDLGFYSALFRAASKVKNASLPAKSWVNALKKQPFVKQEEIEWTGLEEWLDTKNGRVSKEEILDFLEAGGVCIEEVVKGGKDGKLYTFADVESVEHDEELDQRTVYFSDGMTANDLIDEDDEDAVYTALMRVNDSSLRLTVSGGQVTKFADYTLPAGDDYREILLKLPDNIGLTEAERQEEERLARRMNNEPDFPAKDLERMRELQGKSRRQFDSNFHSDHWSELNILAHMRLNDRDVNGERVLFIEEIQSDWSHAGRKNGFATGEEVVVRDFGGNELGVYPNRSDAEKAHEGRRVFIDPANKHERGTLDAPFVKDSGWQNLALKRVMRLAAEEGYDRVAWVTGEQTAERYSLDKKIERIEYTKTYKGEFDIETSTFNEGVIDEATGVFAESTLEQLFGKDVAGKIVQGDNAGTIQGDDLKINAGWARELYDKAVPNWMQKFGKKYKVKPEPIRINAGIKTIEDCDNIVTPATLESALCMARKNNDTKSALHLQQTIDKVEMGMAIEELPFDDLMGISCHYIDRALTEQVEGGSEQLSLPITDSMRRDIMQGMPLFACRQPERKEQDMAYQYIKTDHNGQMFHENFEGERFTIQKEGDEWIEYDEENNFVGQYNSLEALDDLLRETWNYARDEHAYRGDLDTCRPGM